MKVGFAVDESLKILKLSNRGLASLLGMDPHTLIENKKKNWDELKSNTYRKLWVVCQLINKEFFLLSPSIILEILNEHVFENSEGFKESVISAISNEEEYANETVLNIGRLAYKVYFEKNLRKSAKIPDGIPA